MACGTSVPRSGIEPGPRQWKPRILTTRPPGNTLILFTFCSFDWIISNDLSLNWLILSPFGPICCWSSLLNFSSVTVFFSSDISFIFFCPFVELLILFLYCFLDFIKLIICVVALWTSLEQLFKELFHSLLGNSCIFTSLVSVTRGFLCSFGGVMFPWMFVISIAYHRCLHIWRSSHLFQTLLTERKGKERPSPVGGAYWSILWPWA